jgi:muramoyltetrapeptide carboxypeptidase
MSIKPAALKSKDRIALLAPASRPAKPSAVKRAEAIVHEMGFTPVVGAHVMATHGAMAGRDEERLADLVNAMNDESISAIWFLTGGFGSLRLLQNIPYDKFARSPKIVMGADDNSHLLLALNHKTKVVTFNGPNVDRIDSKEAFEKVRKTLSSHEHFSTMTVHDSALTHFCHSPVQGEARGPLVAANLTALISLFGTDYEPALAGAILLLEDRMERNDILDRWFTTLYISNKLSTVAALGLGQFEDCGTRAAFNMLSFEELVEDRVKQMALPTCFNLPFGQSSRCDIVPIGVTAELDTTVGKLVYTEPALSKN